MTKVKEKVEFRNRISGWMRFCLLAITAAAFLIFGLLNHKFFGIENVMAILRTSSIVGIVSLGMMLPLAAGELDFAVGAEASFAGVMLGVLMDRAALADWYIAIVLLTVCACALVGAVNSFLVVRVGMPAFVATLGMSTLLGGYMKKVTNGSIFFSVNWPSSFTWLGQGFLLKVIPAAVVVFALLAVIVFLFTEKTRPGRYIFCVGANKEACRNVGIPVIWMKVLAFVLCAAVSGFAGIVQASVLNVTSPYQGDNLLLNAISATMLGATFYKPGMFNVPGSVVAAVLMAIISNGMTMLGFNLYVKDVVLGIILVIAVGVIATIRKGGLPSVSFAK